MAGLSGGRANGATFLIYHRVGGGSMDELDVSTKQFRAHVDALADHAVVAVDEAADGLEQEITDHRVVLTFDDGFEDVYHNAWPLLRDRRLPFTIYLTTGYVGGAMRWEGSTARDQGAPGLSWDQLREMVDSGLCTIGNHTHTHVRPEELSADELDRCTEMVQKQLGVTPQHFAYTWGVPVPAMEPLLRERFRTAATGHLGRNLPHTDAMRFDRVPVRRTDPVGFFRAKLTGGLLPERVYAGMVATAKRAGVRG